MELLGRAELLMMPPTPVTALQLELMLFVTEEEQEGSRDDNPVPLGEENTELFEHVLGIEELEC